MFQLIYKYSLLCTSYYYKEKFILYIRGDWERTVKGKYSPTLHTNKKAMTTNKACENNTEKNGQTATEQMKHCPDSGCIMHVHYEEMRAKVQ